MINKRCNLYYSTFYQFYREMADKSSQFLITRNGTTNIFLTVSCNVGKSVFNCINISTFLPSAHLLVLRWQLWFILQPDMEDMADLNDNKVEIMERVQAAMSKAWEYRNRYVYFLHVISIGMQTFGKFLPRINQSTIPWLTKDFFVCLWITFFFAEILFLVHIVTL